MGSTSRPAAEMVGASPDAKLWEGKAARKESAAAAIALADSPASDMEWARGGPALGRGARGGNARADLPAAAACDRSPPEVRERKASREGSAVAAIANSPASEVDGGTESRG